MNKKRPIYLHFLDRELKRAENANYDDNSILEAIITSIFTSFSYCYSSVSIVIESSELFPISTDLIFELEKFGFIRLITNEHSFEEFIDARRSIYSFKADRYPMYFDKVLNDLWPRKPLLTNSSTTRILRNNLGDFLDKENNDFPFLKDLLPKTILNTINTKIYKERDKAITLDLFLKPEQFKIDSIRRKTGRLISYLYTKRYIDLYGGDILCGLPNITFYDQLSVNPFLNNSYLIRTILHQLSVPKYFYQNQTFQKERFIQVVSNSIFRIFQIELFAFLSGLKGLNESDKQYNIGRLYSIIVSNIQPIHISNYKKPEVFLSIIYGNLYKASAKLCNNEPLFLSEYKMIKNNLNVTKKILIVTTTAIEARTTITALKQQGLKPITISYDKNTIWNFGLLNGAEIFLIKLSEMGSIKPSSSQLSIYDVIKSLDPDFVIMVGIAFGLRKWKQSIGDIIVSRELQNYESQKKIEDDAIFRSHKIPSGATLLDRFDNSSLIYNRSNVEFGLIISGEVLSDSKSFVDELRSNFPEAIGAEMEGTGLQASCHRDKKEWILIKGICDWGFDKSKNKTANQSKAIKNVTDYLIFTLKNFEF